MEDVERLSKLVDELEKFIRYEQQAISEENWDYFRELAQKKDAHIKKIAQLAQGVDLGQSGLRERLEAIKESQEKTVRALAENMVANQNNMNQLDQAKNKLSKARTYVDKQRKQQKLEAQAKGKGLDETA